MVGDITPHRLAGATLSSPFSIIRNARFIISRTRRLHSLSPFSPGAKANGACHDAYGLLLSLAVLFGVADAKLAIRRVMTSFAQHENMGDDKCVFERGALMPTTYVTSDRTCLHHTWPEWRYYHHREPLLTPLPMSTPLSSCSLSAMHTRARR